jgi:iron-sulfur cluster repair protein YtfE (RIC family)
MSEDAIDLLKVDHEEIRSLLERVDAADGSEKARVAEELFELLEVHTAAEERVFYPAVRDAVDEAHEIIAEGIEEHHVVDTLMAEVRELAPGDEEWDAKLSVIKENVEHHLEEEEHELFPLVEEHLSATDRAEIGAELDRIRTVIDLEAHTVIELREIARANDISGVSDMSKDDLVEAIGLLE